MTSINEPTGEAWIRSVNKRLAQLERLPRVTGATIAAADLSTSTSAAFEADVLMTSGRGSDPSASPDTPQLRDVAADSEDVLDPFLQDEYDEMPVEGRTDLQYAPPTPSDPFVESRTGSVAVIWDGTCAGGEALPVNLLLVEVHRSTEAPDFEPDESTYAGSFLDAGLIMFSDQQFEISWWYRLVLLTNDGRRSTPSNGIVGVAHKITTDEVGFSASEIDFDGAIASANGKNKITYSTGTPGTTANIAGDLWFQQSGNQIIGQWVGLGGTAWQSTVLRNEVIATLDAGKITTGFLSSARIDAGTIGTQHLAAGSVTTGKIALPTFNRNLVPDPSFEETYTIAADSATNKDQWRTLTMTSSSVQRALRARSGNQSLQILLPGSSSVARILSGVFPVTPGKTYNVTMNVAKEGNFSGALFSARIAGGSTTALTEYPASSTTDDINFNGDDPSFLEGLDPSWLGVNMLPSFVDDNTDGLADGAVGYTSGTVTTGVRSFSGSSQTLSAASIASGGRWGMYWDIEVQPNTLYRLQSPFTLSGTNARLRAYVDGYNQGSLTGGALANVLYSATGNVDITTTAGDFDMLRVYLWLEPTSGLSATSPSAVITSPYLHRVDSTGLTLPGTGNFASRIGEFTVPAGINYCAVRLIGTGTTAAQSFFVDDVSVLEAGLGGSELTAAGLRLFDTDGTESAALVSNRPNYFTVSDNGITLASISDDGGGSFQTLAVRGTDTDADGQGDTGMTIFGTEFRDWMRKPAQGVVAQGSLSTGGTTYAITDVETPLFEIAFDGDPSREFWFHIDPMIFDVSGTTDSRVAIIVRATTDGSQPTTSSALVRQAIGSCIAGLPTSLGMDITGQFSFFTRLLVSGIIYSGSTTGTVAGNNNVLRAASYDMGPKVDDNVFVLRHAGGGSSTIQKTYTTTWTSTGWAMYNASGARKTNADDVKQGYSSYDGDAKGLWIFPSMTSTLSGSTISKVEVYLYANHWYYNSGGTALIDLHDRTSIPSNWSSVSRINGVNSTNWPKPGGRWVTIPNTGGTLYSGLISGAWRGIAVGPAGTTNPLYYGRFNGPGAKIRITYKK